MTAYEYFESYIPLVHKIYHKDFTDYPTYREDLLQEGYMGLWRSCIGFKDSLGVKFITYAYRSVKNSMLNYVERFILKHQVQSLEAEISEDIQVSLEDLLCEEDNSYEKELIRVCLEKTPLDDKQKIDLIMQGYTQNEIAEMLSTSQTAVSRCLQRFRKELLKEMEE